MALLPGALPGYPVGGHATDHDVAPLPPIQLHLAQGGIPLRYPLNPGNKRQHNVRVQHAGHRVCSQNAGTPSSPSTSLQPLPPCHSHSHGAIFWNDNHKRVVAIVVLHLVNNEDRLARARRFCIAVHVHDRSVTWWVEAEALLKHLKHVGLFRALKAIGDTLCTL